MDRKRKDFIMCAAILMLIYFCGTVIYFSQIYRMEMFYDSETITTFLSGWNYLSQAAGIAIFILIHKYRQTLTENGSAVCLSIVLSIPVLAISISTTNMPVQICMVILSNMLIGFQTAFGFSLMAEYIEEKWCGRCFALAYSIGGIGTWVISLVNESFMRTQFVLFPSVILSAAIAGLVIVFLHQERTRNEERFERHNEYGESVNHSFAQDLKHMNYKTMIYIVVMLMAGVAALGSNDSVLIEYGNQLNFLSTRVYYAAGLLAAGILFDLRPAIGATCTLGALLYPLMVIMLYCELPGNTFVIGLTDTFIGFFAVWRTCCFIKLHIAGPGQAASASLGLLISRVIEGGMIIFLSMVSIDRLTCFIAAGILYMLLVVSFIVFMQMWDREQKAEIFIRSNMDYKDQDEGVYNEEEKEEQLEKMTVVISKDKRRVDFAKQYHLTRREEEIAEQVAEGRTNGEIAAALNVSESTVRFHVSNILKKTDMKNRNEVARSYYSGEFTYK